MGRKVFAFRHPLPIFSMAFLLIGAVLIGFMAGFAPDTTYGLSMAVVATALAGVIFSRLELKNGKASRDVVFAAIAFRYCMALANLAIGLWFYRGAVDFRTYNEIANWMGEKFLAGDFSGLSVWGGITGWLFSFLLGLVYLYAGPGYLGKFFVSALVGFVGSYLFLQSFRSAFPEVTASHRFLAFALFFLPSFAYWTSLLGKESWMALFLGLTTYAFSKLVTHFSIHHLGMLLVGILGTTLIRPPVGAIVVVAAGIALLLTGPRRGPAAILRPVVVTGTGTVIAGAFIGLSSFALTEKFQGAEAAAKGLVYALYFQHAGLATDPSASGSSIGVQIAEPTLGGLLWYLPLGVFTFLFRPLVFEAHNALALIAALETTFLLILVLWRSRYLFVALRRALSHPFLGFVVMSFLMLTVVLSFESNFGAIVRHRSMVLPFLLMLLAIPRARAGLVSSPSLRGRVGRGVG